MIHTAKLERSTRDQAILQSAGEALRNLRGLGAYEQSQVAEVVLRQALQEGSKKTRDLASQALEVMAKFPNFPRPRAAVGLRALDSLIKG